MISKYLLGFLGLNFTGTPRDDVEVDDGVEDEQQVHGRDHQQVQDTGHDAPKLLRMETGCYEERP